MIHINWPLWMVFLKENGLTKLSHLKILWTVWHLQTFILVSLGLQIILIFLAPFRKKTGNAILIVIVWLAYLLADFVAIQAVGLIPNYNTKSGSKTHRDLLAFWAPFLLVHLGGPDPITALALEDNELWTRTFLHLVSYGSATARVFFQSLPSNVLWAPTIFMFVAGILKFLERTMSLYNASLTTFKSSMLTEPDPGPDYAKLMDSYDCDRKFGIPARFETNLEPDQYNGAFSVDCSKEWEPLDLEQQPPQEEGEKEKSSWELFMYWCCCCLLSPASSGSVRRKQDKRKLRNVKLVRDAFEFYEKYKGLYVDQIFTFHDRNKSRTYFLDNDLPEQEAFSVLEMELNFTYEVFYTKMIVIHQTIGFWIRTASSTMEVASLLVWILLVDKSQFQSLDIWITNILLVGAIAIDLVAYIMVKTSDWKVAMLSKESERRAFLYNKMLSVRNRTWGAFWGPEKTPFKSKIRRILFRRWSETVSQLSLLRYCVDRWGLGATILFKVLPPVENMCEGFSYVSTKWFSDELRNFIFHQIKSKAMIAEDPKEAEEICESKGDWVLRALAGLGFEAFDFLRWTRDVEYDECLLLWHIATELLYQEGEPDPTKIKRKTALSEKEMKFRTISKTLADYMIYLLNRQPVMMFAVAGISEVRCRDTCAEANMFFDRVMLKQNKKETMEMRMKNACKMLMDVNTEVNPKDIKGDRSKSLLFDAVQLAKALKKMGEKAKTTGMWEMTAKVWVDLLSYSATHTRASAHAALLKKGGELLTLVWLLMVHMGLGRHFRITQGNVTSKIITSQPLSNDVQN